MMLSLSACETRPCVKTVPDYPAEFYTQVANEFEAKTYGPYTENVVKDWMVMVGI